MKRPKSLDYQKSFKISMIIGTFVFTGVMGYISLDYFIKEKITTAHYHFNVQYRVGNEIAMSEVVNNTLYPLLQLYERNPGFRANLEMQSLTLEWMNKTNPECSNLLRKLVLDTRQIQLVLIQYSSALAIAYPYIDMYKSINHTQYLIEEFFGVYPDQGISRAVLLQEGQFMMGASRILEDFKKNDGKPLYDTFLATKECLSFFGITTHAPIYTAKLTGREEIYVLPYAQSVYEAGVFHSVLWFTDGELVNSGFEELWTADGYWETDAEFFEEIEEMTENHEKRLLDLQQQGNKFLTLDEWIAYLLERNEAKALDHYVPETHWQATRYRGVFVWMCQSKGGTAYSDGEICSRNYLTHQYLMNTEVLLNFSRYNTTGVNQTMYSSLYNQLYRAWLDLAEAQVTDTTGISPRDFEGQFAIDKTNQAIANATNIQEIVINATIEFNTTVNVNNESIQIIPSNIFENIIPVTTNRSEFINFTLQSSVSQDELLPIQIETVNDLSMNITEHRLQTIWQPTIDNLTYYKIRVHFQNTTNLSEKWAYIKFLGDFSTIGYSPSLLDEDVVFLNRDTYYPDTTEYYEDWDARFELDNFEIYLPLANGLIYSENGGYAIIKNNSASHICGKWNPGEIRFMQTEIKNATGETWEYFLVKGVSASQAREFANLVNAYYPMVIPGGS